MATIVGLALRAVAALYLLGCGAYSAYAIGALAMRRTQPLLLRWSVTAALGMWLATAGFELLLPLGAFTLVGALVGCTLLTLAIRTVVHKAMGSGSDLAGFVQADRRALRRLARAWRGASARQVGAFFAVLALLIVVRTLAVPPLGWDTITYHGLRSALWVQTGRATLPRAPGTWNLYRHFFGGSEVLAAWAMLPFHSDLLAGATSAVQWLTLGLALWALGRELGLREPYAGYAAIAGIFIPTLQRLVGSGFVEVSLYAALFAGLAVALRALRHPRPGLVFAAAAALGVAAGIKPQALPPVVLVLAALGLRILGWKQAPWRRRLWVIAGGVVIAALPVAPWLALAWRDTGFPLSPLPVHLGSLTLGVRNDELRWYMQRPGLAPYHWSTEIRALRAVFPWPGGRSMGVGSGYLLPVALFPIGFVKLARRRTGAAAVCLGVLATILATHFSPNMSVVRLLWAASMSREVAPAVLLALPISMSWCADRPRLGASYRALVVAVAGFYGLARVFRGWAPHELSDVIVIIACVAVLLVAWMWTGARKGRPAFGLAVFAIAIAIGLVGLSRRRDATRIESLRSSTQTASPPRYWAAAAERLDDPSHPHRIALTSGPDQNADNWFAYFFLGRRMQNRLFYISPLKDGALPPRLLGPGWLPRLASGSRADEAAWVRRLARQDVTEVMSFRPRSLELVWMNHTPARFRRIAGALDWGLYRFVPDGSSRGD